MTRKKSAAKTQWPSKGTLCRCGCGQSPLPGRLFVKGHRPPRTTCRVCSQPAHAQGLCNKHYLRLITYGSTGPSRDLRNGRTVSGAVQGKAILDPIGIAIGEAIRKSGGCLAIAEATGIPAREIEEIIMTSSRGNGLVQFSTLQVLFEHLNLCLFEAKWPLEEEREWEKWAKILKADAMNKRRERNAERKKERRRQKRKK